jgi:hypothetical protein
MNKISRSIVQTAMLLLFIAHVGLAQTAAPTEKQIEVFGQKISYRLAGFESAFRRPALPREC